MWKVLLICVVMSALNEESSGAKTGPTRRRRAYAGGYAGGYASSGGGAVGHSSYVGTGGGGGGYYDYDDYGGTSPNFGIIDPYLFHQQLTNHILAQNFANQQAITGLATAGNAYASADASLVDDNDIRIQQQIAAQQAYHDNLVRQNRYRGGSSSSSSSGFGSGSGSGSYNSHRYAPSYASASGSIGSNGYRQTAYISPSNPASPNIVNRFGGGSGGGSSFSSSSSSGLGGGSGGGYKGVSVSSFSHSNGDGTSRRGAQTTVNDNGKITSYSVHS
ncbi:keratin, type I cytoskeletal 9 isoform X1 [Drosophila sechellia]|uniref:GM17015 n=1 Tax=Drosophila sechellia TaxID=7238 RepID=B4I5U0_DROSE|nr:keratin, type I cytoskeletal 9 isoform X1 [Drosophila sechellia]XP_032575989.1 keratin, type I cytoskeletal 9 isoform X1 [Drosophila sechellia]EDW55746.1 GM17015 [Drosophila sechellia]